MHELNDLVKNEEIIEMIRSSKDDPDTTAILSAGGEETPLLNMSTQ